MSCTKNLAGYITPVVEEPPLHYTATPVGGSAPYAFEWSVAQNGDISGDVNVSIDGANNTQTVKLTDPGINDAAGLLRCKITDGNGCIAYAFYMAVIPFTIIA